MSPSCELKSSRRGCPIEKGRGEIQARQKVVVAPIRNFPGANLNLAPAEAGPCYLTARFPHPSFSNAELSQVEGASGMAHGWFVDSPTCVVLRAEAIQGRLLAPAASVPTQSR